MLSLLLSVYFRSQYASRKNPRDKLTLLLIAGQGRESRRNQHHSLPVLSQILNIQQAKPQKPLPQAFHSVLGRKAFMPLNYRKDLREVGIMLEHDRPVCNKQKHTWMEASNCCSQRHTVQATLHRLWATVHLITGIAGQDRQANSSQHHKLRLPHGIVCHIYVNPLVHARVCTPGSWYVQFG